MIISFIRTVILLFMVTAAVRLMGKRQIGQLQPSELVITILLSETAVVPMQDNDIPMVNTFVAVCVLIGIEIIIAAIGVKSDKFRSVLEGNSVMIIKDGVLQQKNMKKLRFTLDDIIEALRQNGVFDISEVQYAFAETNGTLSILQKPEKRPFSNENAGKIPEDTGLAVVAVMDGKIIKRNLTENGVSEKQVRHIINKSGILQENIFLLTVDKKGNVNLVERENGLD